MRRRSFRPTVDRLEVRTVLSLTETAPAAAVAPIERTDSYAVQHHHEILAQIGAHRNDVVLFGDSMVEFWEPIASDVWNEKLAPLDAANFGVASDKTQHLLWRLENGELAGRPRFAVVQIGTNDILYSTTDPDVRVADTVAGVTAVVAAIRRLSPETKIVLMGILPSGQTPDDPYRLMIQRVNQQIATLADGENVRFLDIGPLFLQPDGSRIFGPNAFHPTPQQYDAWADALHRSIQQWLGRPVAPTVQTFLPPRSKRKPATIVLTFSTSLNPDSAEDQANYTLSRATPRSRPFEAQRLRRVLIKPPTYDPTTKTVTLRFLPTAPASRYVLTVQGDPPSGVEDVYGDFLDGLGDGTPGTDYVAEFRL